MRSTTSARRSATRLFDQDLDMAHVYREVVRNALGVAICLIANNSAQAIDLSEAEFDHGFSGDDAREMLALLEPAYRMVQSCSLASTKARRLFADSGGNPDFQAFVAAACGKSAPKRRDRRVE